jgi:ABC-type sugar transport system ATPase subunit
MIRLEKVAIRAGQFALRDLDWEIPPGAYAVLMGRTGSGKTSILEAICGLRSVSAGRIWLMNEDVTNYEPASRGIGYVPQDRALFQTMTVGDNLAFSLRLRKWQPDDIARRVAELAELLGIRSLLQRKPHGLSGGEAQRVALGRALAAKPGILCLDEPLSALDDETRNEMYTLLKSVKQHARVTTLHITHHQGEATELADKIYRLNEGRIVEV